MSMDDENDASHTLAMLNERVLAAAKDNDVFAARAALAAGGSANAVLRVDAKEWTDERSATPVLYIACKAGNEEMVELLLENGADPNSEMFRQGIVDRETTTCLNASLSKSKIADLLLRAGANPDNPNSWGEDCTTYSYPLDIAWHMTDGQNLQELLRAFGAKKSVRDGTASPWPQNHQA